MNNRVILESLSMDLLRVALGFHRGSLKMAERFSKEALGRKREIVRTGLQPYMYNILTCMEKSLLDSDVQKKAEDALMYSTLIQNYCRKVLSSTPG